MCSYAHAQTGLAVSIVLMGIGFTILALFVWQLQS
jgi:hypothetical protein